MNEVFKFICNIQNDFSGTLLPFFYILSKTRIENENLQEYVLAEERRETQ